MVNSVIKQMPGIVEPTYLALRATPRENLWWVTVIIDVRIVSLSDDVASDIIELVEQFHDEWRQAMMTSGFIGRIKGRPATRWAGVIEFDLLHPEHLGGKHKRDLREALGVDAAMMRLDQRVLVLHAHLVVDDRGHSSHETMMRDVRASWPGPWRVVAIPLYKTGSVSENLSNLAGYSTKFQMRYSEAWEGKRTSYHGNFKPEWREYVTGLYEAIGVQQMLITNVKSRAGQSSKCKVVNEKTVAPQGVDADPRPMQLNITSTDPEENETPTLTKPSQRECNMRMKEIAPYLDPERISQELLHDIILTFDRSPPVEDRSHLIQTMYSADDDDMDLLSGEFNALASGWGAADFDLDDLTTDPLEKEEQKLENKLLQQKIKTERERGELIKAKKQQTVSLGLEAKAKAETARSFLPYWKQAK
jgi:hypothetical protein